MYNFDVKEQTKNVVDWTREWVNKSGNENTKVIIGISGGKDSTCVAAILCEAIGKDRVIGVMMPNGEQKDISDSQKVCKLLDIKNVTIDISKGYKPLSEEITNKLGLEPTHASETNSPARARMLTLYDICGRIGNCRVVNTCNLSEDFAYGNYSTLYGDSAGDFAPLQGFTVTEVRAIGDYLGLPKELIHKAPSDGMCGSTDEDNLSRLYGIDNWTYSEFDKFIRGQENTFNDAQKEKLFDGAKGGKFKRDLIKLPKFNPDLPNIFC